MKIGSRLKKLRVTNNMTQKELADKLGVDRKMVSFYENDKNEPKLDTLVRYTELFNASADWILGIKEMAVPGIPGATARIMDTFKNMDDLKDFIRKVASEEKNK